tara:strand:+ start:149 stop:436 length:288 start_codon:yes stop_codon:yes gene_type:complete
MRTVDDIRREDAVRAMLPSLSNKQKNIVQRLKAAIHFDSLDQRAHTPDTYEAVKAYWEENKYRENPQIQFLLEILLVERSLSYYNRTNPSVLAFG